MGRTRRPSPRKLAGKLRKIRADLGLSQEQMAVRLKAGFRVASLRPGHISEFETGKREPSVLILLAYAKLAEVSTDVLIDDKAELPGL